MMTTDKKENAEYSDYVVAFCDILGQKASFDKFFDAKGDSETNKELLDAHRNSVSFVRNLRKDFDNFVEAFTTPRELPQSIPTDKINLFSRLRDINLDRYYHADSIQLFTKWGTKNTAPFISGIYGIFLACAGMFLLALSREKILRIGIEFDLATKFDNEIYGPALFKAVNLEQAARHPRIVIGPKLINFLKAAENGNVEFGPDVNRPSPDPKKYHVNR